MKSTLTWPPATTTRSSSSWHRKKQQKTLMTLASQGIEKADPKLTEDARLVLTADVLTSLNFSNSAATALSTVQEKYPETAKSATFRNLAGKVSVRTGRPDMVDAAAPQVHVDEAVQPADRSKTTEAQRRELTQLADTLATVPTTAAEATVLKGDVQTAAGDNAAAAATYERAREVKVSPVTTDRVRRASVVEH
jgi:predicted negative regulator of RcsB-dependent stress response